MALTPKGATMAIDYLLRVVDSELDELMPELAVIAIEGAVPAARFI